SGFASVGANSGSSVFGAPSKSSTSPFASSGNKDQPNILGGGGNTSSSPFASAANNNGSSLFGGPSKPAVNPFGAPSAEPTTSIFSASANADKKPPNPFAPKPEGKEKPSGGLFGSEPFKLESSFKPDPSAKDDNEKPSSGAGSSLFGSGFGSALDAASKNADVSPPVSKDEEMEAE